MDTKRNFNSRGRKWYALTLTILVAVFLGVWGIVGTPGQARGETGTGLDGTPHYLPLVRLAEPTPTFIPPTEVPPVPQFVKNVAPPDSQCPNSIGFNAISGYVYIPNNFSFNVSAFKDGNFVTNIPMGTWPTFVAADNDSPLTYITVLQDQVTVVNGTTIVGKIPDQYEPYDAVVNPVNGYTYITDLDSTVQIADGITLLTNLTITDPEVPPPGNGAGWLQPIVVDPNTGLVYVASWSHGKMYVLDDMGVVANYRAGWGVKDMAIDAGRGYIYLAHSEPNEIYTNNISVFNIATQTMTRIDTDADNLNNSRAVAVDPISGYAYFTNPDQNTVTVLLGTHVITTLPAGEMPWDVGVNPNTGYVFVANRNGNDVTVMKGLAVATTIPTQGQQPFAVGVDTINNDVYIANRGEEYAQFQCRNASVTILR